MATTNGGGGSHKPGIWTEHVDPATGRTYFFNLVHTRSYWTLPEDERARVRVPVLTTWREWDPEAAARFEAGEAALAADNSAPQPQDHEEQRRRRQREEVLAAMAAAEAIPGATGNGGGTGSVLGLSTLQERMAQAAQRLKEEELQRVAAEQPQQQRHGDEAADNSEYLKMVRELQAKDRDTADTGNKWLVR